MLLVNANLSMFEMQQLSTSYGLYKFESNQQTKHVNTLHLFATGNLLCSQALEGFDRDMRHHYAWFVAFSSASLQLKLDSDSGRRSFDALLPHNLVQSSLDLHRSHFEHLHSVALNALDSSWRLLVVRHVSHFSSDMNGGFDCLCFRFLLLCVLILAGFLWRHIELQRCDTHCFDRRSAYQVTL